VPAFMFKRINMDINIKRVKIFVTIPLENVAEVREAVCLAGAGFIGNYSFCTYSVKGVGSFKPNNNANPYIGTKNEIEFVEEEKLEFVCYAENVKNVLKALRKAHPYEEPGIDIVPLIEEGDFI